MRERVDEFGWGGVGRVYLEAEDFGLHEREGLAVYFDEAFAGLCVDC